MLRLTDSIEPDEVARTVRLGQEPLLYALLRDGSAAKARAKAELQPGAPPPALHESDAILRDAERQRARDGTSVFSPG